jgi:hypothetical protein
MNTSYLIYQAERTKSAAEQREADRAAGEFAASLAGLWRRLAAPRRARRRGSRAPAPCRAPVQPRA